MTKYTIYTPTYNRAKTLPRLYRSLLKQTFTDFEWPIVDDGSNDKTFDLIKKWRKENKIKIKYQYKENGGKHSATKIAYQIANSKYIVGIDSDDELLPEAMESFNLHWSAIEEQNLENKFAEVSAQTIYVEGDLVGNYTFRRNDKHVDSNWHEMVLRHRNNNEHVACRNLTKLKICADIPNKLWLSDQINFLNEFVLWARLGRRYKTRYINKTLRIYHLDAGPSLMRINDKKQVFYNTIVGNKYFIDENINYFLWNPIYFFNLCLKFSISGITLKIPIRRLLTEINNPRYKFLYIASFPIAVIAYVYCKYIKKKFWF